MRSVADGLRFETRREVAQRSPAERIELAFRLGDDDVALLCAARGLAPEPARQAIAQSRRLGRVPSAAAAGTTR